MEISLIEKLDKTRDSVLKWQTIGWGVWFGTFILKDLIVNKPVVLILIFIGLIGWGLWTVNLIKMLRLVKKINSDSKLREALNNEMYRLNQYKSFSVGFMVVLVTIGCFMGFSEFYDISALLVCQITLYLGLLSTFIALFIYNRG